MLFGWRKRNEGFEWKEYVRTTVLVRRADRQRRLDDARLAALAKVQDVKERGIEVGKAGIDVAADQAARAAKATGRTLGDVAIAAFWGIVGFLGSCRDVVVKIVTPYLPERDADSEADERPLHERTVAQRPRAKARAVVDAEIVTPGRPRPASPDIGPTGRLVFEYGWKAAAAIAVVLVAGRMLQAGAPSIETGSVSRPAALTAEPLELAGRASAVTGDTLRVNSQVVRLKGVMAPEDNQPCYTDRGKRYLCSVTSKKALEALVRGRRVACVPDGSTVSGAGLATCDIDGEDIAQALTRAGHLFAETGFFAAYGSDEALAREAKVGVWQGESMRPDDWRAQVFEEAKKTAPDGCPIRGVMRGGVGVYAMPWSRDYAAARSRPSKSERWFCSEDEAREAGYRPAVRS